MIVQKIENVNDKLSKETRRKNGMKLHDVYSDFRSRCFMNVCSTEMCRFRIVTNTKCNNSCVLYNKKRRECVNNKCIANTKYISFSYCVY